MVTSMSAHFDGETYESSLDQVRMTRQLRAVFEFMKDGSWYTPERISAHCGGSVAGITARIRDLRKDRFGAYKVSSRRVGRGGSWEYSIMNATEVNG